MAANSSISCKCYLLGLAMVTICGCPPSPQDPSNEASTRLCKDKYCNVRGDFRVAARATNATFYIDDPYTWIGMKVDPTSANWSRLPCGDTRISADDLEPKNGASYSGSWSYSWVDSSSLKVQLVAKLSQILASVLAGKAGADASLEKAVERTFKRNYVFNSTVYTVHDLAWHKRVEQCGGQTDGAMVIYSVATIQLNGSSKEELKSKLKENLRAEFGVASPVAEAGVDIGVNIDQASDEAVEKTVPTQPFVVALGFRNK